MTIWKHGTHKNRCAHENRNSNIVRHIGNVDELYYFHMIKSTSPQSPRYFFVKHALPGIMLLDSSKQYC